MSLPDIFDKEDDASFVTVKLEPEVAYAKLIVADKKIIFTPTLFS